jgi:hypothetical protein
MVKINKAIQPPEDLRLEYFIVYFVRALLPTVQAKRLQSAPLS